VLSSMPLLGTLTFVGALSLAGTPPFNIFISEFIILKAAVDKGLWPAVVIFLIFAVVVFYGILSGFGRMLFGKEVQGSERAEEKKNPGNENKALSDFRPSGLSYLLGDALMLVMTALIITFGFMVPDVVDSAIKSCVGILGVK
jgi:formate hydrogenlyase subunit 3/multisubunit Na+/H+ antiporter MnhD subunit